MAADGVNILKLHLIHGPDKYDVSLELPSEEAGDVLTTQHLATEVQHLTNVPQQRQRLIFKGKSLTESSASLKSQGLKNGAKIMLIGRRFCAEADSDMKTMGIIEKDLEKNEKKLSEIIYELDGINRGFLAQEHQEEALTKLQRRLGTCAEVFCRQLESLDSLALSESPTEVKEKRKSLVSRIQSLLGRSDTIKAGVDEMLTRLGM